MQLWKRNKLVPIFRTCVGKLLSLCVFFSICHSFEAQTTIIFFYSNISNFVPEKVFLRGVLLHYFNMKKTAVKSHRILVEVYGEHALAARTCQKWFARFKSGDFDLEDEERPG